MSNRLSLPSRRELILLGSAGLMAAPLSAKVRILESKSRPVTTYKTYEWLPPRIMARFGLLEEDNSVVKGLKESVNREVSSKGYVEVPSGADMKLTAGAFATVDSQLEGFLLQWGWDWYWGPIATGAAPVTRTNREGTLVVALIETLTDKGVWGGIDKALIGKPESVGKDIEKAVQNICKKLPQRPE